MIVTACRDDEHRRRAKELGALKFLTKPIDFDLLRVRLRELPMPLTEEAHRSIEWPLTS
jgi:DNA-binding response OmpR family regulator